MQLDHRLALYTFITTLNVTEHLQDSCECRLVEVCQGRFEKV